jgi:hypothetical protein
VVVVLADFALGFDARGWNYQLRALLVEVCNSDWQYRCEVKARQRVISTSEGCIVIAASTLRDMNYFPAGSTPSIGYSHEFVQCETYFSSRLYFFKIARS